MLSRIVPIMVLICFLFVNPAYSGVNNNAAPENTGRSGRRIVGGDVVTDPNAWPFMAALVFADSTPPFSGMQCGGSLIGPKWVLTAAHCVEDTREGGIYSPETFEIILGSRNLNDGNEWDRVKIKRIIMHPNYGDMDENTPDFDVALIELEEEKFGYEPIELLTGDDSPANRDAVVIGWGRTDGWGNEQGEAEEHRLRQVSVGIVSNEDCQAAADKIAAANPGEPASLIDSSMLCAGVIEGGKDSCNGDSGGPLVINDNGTWKQAGIVSFGMTGQCAEKGTYGVYARVSEIDQFLNDAKTGIYLEGKVGTSFAGHDSLGILNAVVSIDGTDFQTVTKNQGAFQLLAADGSLPADSYEVTVRADGFNPLSRTIQTRDKAGSTIYLERLSVVSDIESARQAAYEKGFQEGLAKMPTIDSDFSLSIPQLKYNDNKTEKYYWLNLRYAPQGGKVVFEMKDSGLAEAPKTKGYDNR